MWVQIVEAFGRLSIIHLRVAFSVLSAFYFSRSFFYSASKVSTLTLRLNRDITVSYLTSFSLANDLEVRDSIVDGEGMLGSIAIEKEIYALKRRRYA